MGKLIDLDAIRERAEISRELDGFSDDAPLSVREAAVLMGMGARSLQMAISSGDPTLPRFRRAPGRHLRHTTKADIRAWWERGEQGAT